MRLLIRHRQRRRKQHATWRRQRPCLCWKKSRSRSSGRTGRSGRSGRSDDVRRGRAISTRVHLSTTIATINTATINTATINNTAKPRLLRAVHLQVIDDALHHRLWVYHE